MGGAGKPARTGKGKSGRHKPPIWRRKVVRGRVRAVRRRWKYTRRSVRRVYNRRYRFTYRSKITRVPARDELPALLNARGLLGRGAEIGVKLGAYSDELLSNWRGEELVSIDPWLSADPDEYVDRSNVSQDEFNSYYEQTCERLARHGARSSIWRMTSVEAAAKVADHSFDFVYIDARHDYESVKEDLQAWCGKVRPGGILAGHDYVDGDLPQGEFYVKSAVDEFFGALGHPGPQHRGAIGRRDVSNLDRRGSGGRDRGPPAGGGAGCSLGTTNWSLSRSTRSLLSSIRVLRRPWSSSSTSGKPAPGTKRIAEAPTGTTPGHFSRSSTSRRRPGARSPRCSAPPTPSRG